MQSNEDWSQSELLASIRADRVHERKGEYVLMSREVAGLTINLYAQFVASA